MLDRAAAALIRPAIDALARALACAGISADAITLAGFGIGLGAAALIASGQYGWGTAVLLLSRLCDGLDGAVARLRLPSDRGAFLDIALDFVFYASIPLAYALADPARNALAGAVLLAAFVGTGTSFLAFAVLAAKRGLTSSAYPNKSFYFLGGLTEATETLAFFVACGLWPGQFALLAYGFAALCAITLLARLWWGWQAFGPGQ